MPVHQVETRLAERVGSAPSNVATAAPPWTRSWRSSCTATPYVFDHLAPTDRDLEQALIDRFEETPLAFGQGMAFVGRQVRFDPAHVGQQGAYVAVFDDRLRRSDGHAATVGILLQGRNDTLVR